MFWRRLAYEYEAMTGRLPPPADDTISACRLIRRLLGDAVFTTRDLVLPSFRDLPEEPGLFRCLEYFDDEFEGLAEFSSWKLDELTEPLTRLGISLPDLLDTVRPAVRNPEYREQQAPPSPVPNERPRLDHLIGKDLNEAMDKSAPKSLAQGEAFTRLPGLLDPQSCCHRFHPRL
jgi:hypothetical protein